MTAEELIKRGYGNSRNFMTPNIKVYGWIVEGVTAFELSSGKNMAGQQGGLWGVSLVTINSDGNAMCHYYDHDTMPSKAFCSEQEAVRYLLRLQFEQE